MDTRWVLTIPTSGGQTFHVLTDSAIEAEDVAMELWVASGELPPVTGADIREVPATWGCDGRDGCLVSA